MVSGEVERYILVVPDMLDEKQNDPSHRRYAAIHRKIVNNFNNTGFTAQLVSPDVNLAQIVRNLASANREISIVATGESGRRAMKAAMETSMVRRVIAIATPFHTYPEREDFEAYLASSGMSVLTMQPDRNDPILRSGQGSLRGSTHIEYPFDITSGNRLVERITHAFRLQQTFRRFLMAPQRVRS